MDVIFLSFFQVSDAHRRREVEKLAELHAERQRLAEQAIAAVREKEEQEKEAAARDAVLRERIRAEKDAGLPPEPSPGDDDLVNVMFRMPDGSRFSRRFRVSDRVPLLFDFVDSKGAGGLMPGTYRLVKQFPKATYQHDSADTLGAAGLDQGQYTMMLEHIRENE